MYSKIRINENTSAAYDNIYSLIQTMTSRYDFLDTWIYGRSVMGKALPVSCLGLGSRRIFVSAAHHGNEWLTATVLLKFMAELCDRIANNGMIFGVRALSIFRYCRLCFVPIANPDGTDLAMGALAEGKFFEISENISQSFPEIPFPSGWKANIQGVDLNLQYPAGWEKARELKYAQGYDRPAPRDFVGYCPLCEPESAALAELTRKLDPAVLISLHSQGQVIYWQYSDYIVPGSRELGEKLAQASGYLLSETPPYSDNAGLKDWFIQDFLRPGYTVEVGLGSNPLPTSQFDEIFSQVGPLLVTAALG